MASYADVPGDWEGVMLHKYSDWKHDAEKRVGRPLSHGEMEEAFNAAFERLGFTILDMVKPDGGDRLKAETIKVCVERYAT